jgi:hypothetical protein
VKNCNCAVLGTGGPVAKKIAAKLHLFRMELLRYRGLAPTACTIAGFLARTALFLLQACRFAGLAQVLPVFVGFDSRY